MASARTPKVPFPYPYKKGRHEISHAEARRLRKRAITTLGLDGIGRSAAYHRDIFDTILADERVVGIRFYPGVDEKGEVTLVFCGFDAKGNNVLAGTIGDLPYRCPPFCPSRDGIVEL